MAASAHSAQGRSILTASPKTISEMVQERFETLTSAERQLANSLLEKYPVSGLASITAVAKKAYAESRPVKEVALEMTDLTEEELDRLLDPAALTEGGIRN